MNWACARCLRERRRQHEAPKPARGTRAAGRAPYPRRCEPFRFRGARRTKALPRFRHDRIPARKGSGSAPVPGAPAGGTRGASGGFGETPKPARETRALPRPVRNLPRTRSSLRNRERAFPAPPLPGSGGKRRGDGSGAKASLPEGAGYFPELRRARALAGAEVGGLHAAEIELHALQHHARIDEPHF